MANTSVLVEWRTGTENQISSVQLLDIRVSDVFYYS